MTNTLRSYIAELIGTFTLVFVGTGVAALQGFFGHSPAAGILEISFAFGFILMVLIIVIGPISGCHINPAVTIPMALAGRLRWALVPGYIISQLLGALLASVTLLYILNCIPGYELAQHGIGANGNPLKMDSGGLFVMELITTALFLLTIFSSTRPNATPGLAPFAIGGFLLIVVLIGAQMGDASINPARSIGPALIARGDSLKVLWIFVLAPLIGGIGGLGLYKLIYEKAD